MILLDRIKYAVPPALFLWALAVIYKTNFINAIFVQSVCRKIYIPVAFWSIVILYAVLFHVLLFRSHNDFVYTLKKALIFGFSVHLYTMLGDLVISLTKDHSFLSDYYFYYIKLVSLVFTFGISLASVFYIRKLKDKQFQETFYSFLFYLPLFILPIVFIIASIAFFDAAFLISISISYVLPYLFIKGRLFALLWDRIKACIFFLWKDKNFIFFIFIFSFIIRCLFAVNIINKTVANGTNRFILASDDSDRYDKHASEIMKDPRSLIGSKYKIWGGYWDEGYSIFLAGIYKIFGRNFYIVTLIQSFLGSFIPVIIFFIGRLLFSKAVGAIAALAMSLKGPLIFLSVVLGHEAVWMPISILFTLALCRYYKSNRVKYGSIIMAGITLGVICIFRPLYIYLIPFTILWIGLFWHNKTLSDRFQAIVIFMVIVFIIIYSIAIISGSPVSSVDAERLKIVWEQERLYDQFRGVGNSRLIDIGINFSEDITGSIKTIAKDPMKFFIVAAQIYPVRIIAYFEVFQFGFFDPIYLINSASRPNNFMPTLEFYFTFFFIYGLIFCMSKREILKSPIFLLLVFNIVIFTIIFANMAPRYRDASTPFIYLIGSCGFITILKHLQFLKQ